jgi:hypothetical protein
MVRPSKFVRPSATARGRGESCARATVAASSRGGSNNASERTQPNNNAPSSGFRFERGTSERETTSGVAVTIAVTIVDETPPASLITSLG